MRRLVESWIEAERQHYGNNISAAIARMNEKRGTKLTHSRVSEWRRGVYVPSQVILSQMLLRTLPWALRQAGITATDDQVRELESFLWRMENRDGCWCVELL